MIPTNVIIGFLAALVVYDTLMKWQLARRVRKLELKLETKDE